MKKGSAGTDSPCAEILTRRRVTVKAGKRLLDGQNRLTYGVFFDRVARLSNYLAALGIAIGERAVVLSDDDAAVMELFFGLLSRGITVVPLNPHATKSELKLLVGAADASIVFVDEGRVADIDFPAFLRPGSPVVHIRPNVSGGKRLISRLLGSKSNGNDGAQLAYPELLSDFPEQFDFSTPVPASTTAYILFTSGTTSAPKGVEITHANLFAQMETFVSHYGLDANTRILNILPFHHTDGLTHGAAVSLVSGGTLVRPLRFRIDRLPALLDEIYKSRISHFITVPSMLSLIQQLGPEYRDCFDTDEFRFVISTAANLDAGLWSELQESHGIKIVNVYGLTETVCEACYCGPDAETYRLGTIGKPVDCEVRVVGDDGSEMPTGEAGELAIRGANVMRGYFNMPEETEKVLKDGWFHTGDIATIDEDGFVRIVGRKKSLIISGGYNIYPEDVTNVLLQMDGIVDATTLGVPDPTWGEIVVSCIIASPTRELSPSDIADFFLKHAAREKLPRKIYFMEDFPRGPAGKVLLDKLRERIDDSIDEVQQIDGGADAKLSDKVASIAANVFKVTPEQLDGEASPETIPSWNSLAHFEFLMALEIEFGHRFSPRDIMSISNLGQAITVLESKIG